MNTETETLLAHLGHLRREAEAQNRRNVLLGQHEHAKQRKRQEQQAAAMGIDPEVRASLLDQARAVRAKWQSQQQVSQERLALLEARQHMLLKALGADKANAILHGTEGNEGKGQKEEEDQDDEAALQMLVGLIETKERGPVQQLLENLFENTSSLEALLEESRQNKAEQELLLASVEKQFSLLLAPQHLANPASSSSSSSSSSPSSSLSPALAPTSCAGIHASLNALRQTAFPPDAISEHTTKTQRKDSTSLSFCLADFLRDTPPDLSRAGRLRKRKQQATTTDKQQQHGNNQEQDEQGEEEDEEAEWTLEKQLKIKTELAWLRAENAVLANQIAPLARRCGELAQEVKLHKMYGLAKDQRIQNLQEERRVLEQTLRSTIEQAAKASWDGKQQQANGDKELLDKEEQNLMVATLRAMVDDMASENLSLKARLGENESAARPNNKARLGDSELTTRRDNKTCQDDGESTTRRAIDGSTTTRRAIDGSASDASEGMGSSASTRRPTTRVFSTETKGRGNGKPATAMASSRSTAPFFAAVAAAPSSFSASSGSVSPTGSRAAVAVAWHPAQPESSTSANTSGSTSAITSGPGLKVNWHPSNSTRASSGASSLGTSSLVPSSITLSSSPALMTPVPPSSASSLPVPSRQFRLPPPSNRTAAGVVANPYMKSFASTRTARASTSIAGHLPPSKFHYKPSPLPIAVGMRKPAVIPFSSSTSSLSSSSQK
eukprot:gb/GEZN01001715.1/.p1 GENE.gb/GEZN01001715.1/~~gb/GEZN01001715.1/.p1  ORF type:complete len:724 (-),score=164.68 gb/GEZN01001715.1/:403-2574(-)